MGRYTVDGGRWTVFKHVEVDGWANGWLVSKQEAVDSDQEPRIVVIFYWPQLLEYFGFVMLGVTVLGVLIRRDK